MKRRHNARSPRRRLGTLMAMATVGVLTATAARAQAPDVDPPDTEYQTGLEDIDPAVVATLSKAPTFRAFIPPSIDLSFRLPAPGQQGRAGSCTAWSVAYAARAYYTGANENRDIHLRKNIVSPNYVYDVARQLQHQAACKPGSSSYSVVEVLKKGALSLLEYPYHASDCDPAPAPEVIASAVDFKVRGMRLLDVARLDNIKGALAESNPVVIEFHDGESWQKFRGDQVYSDASFDPNDNKWHAMTLVGYSESKQAFRVINSWGQGWGDHGYAWMGYNVFSARVRRAFMLDVPASAPKPEIVPPKPDVVPPKPAVVAKVDEVPPPKPVVKPAPEPVPPPKPAPEPVKVEPPPVKVEPPPAPPVKAEVVPLPEPRPQPQPEPPAPKPQLTDLSSLHCAKVAVRDSGDSRALTGYVASDDDLALVQRIAAATPGARLDRVTVAPWPQCEALQTLEKPLAESDTPKISVRPSTTLAGGDNLTVEIRAPSQISFLYVSYIQADGSVVHLVQPDGVVPQPTLPNTLRLFGDGGEGRARFTVTPPFGREMIVAIASRSPLFDKRLPDQQTEREYLTALRTALVYKPSPNLPDRELSAAMATLTTHAR